MKLENQPAYGLVVETCREHGISRSVAFKLAQEGHLKTFKIGKRRYVFMDSLHALPETLKKAGQK